MPARVGTPSVGSLGGAGDAASVGQDGAVEHKDETSAADAAPSAGSGGEGNDESKRSGGSDATVTLGGTTVGVSGIIEACDTVNNWCEARIMAITGSVEARAVRAIQTTPCARLLLDLRRCRRSESTTLDGARSMTKQSQT